MEIEKSRLVICFSIQPCVQSLTSVQFFPASIQPMAVAFICSTQKHTVSLSLSLAHPHPPSSLSHAIPPFTTTLLLFFSMVGSLTPLMSQHAVTALNGDNGMLCRRGRCGSVWEALREHVYRFGQTKSFGAYFNALSCTMTAHSLGFRKYFFPIHFHHRDFK